MNIGTAATKSGWLLLPVLLVAAGAAWFVMDPGFRPADAPQEASSGMPRNEFERRVRDYILKNPEVIVEAMQRLRVRQHAAEAIDRNLALAQILRITGTPTFVVDKRILRGATDLRTLQGLIREARTER